VVNWLFLQSKYQNELAEDGNIMLVSKLSLQLNIAKLLQPVRFKEANWLLLQYKVFKPGSELMVKEAIWLYSQRSSDKLVWLLKLREVNWLY
jgi:hypothetical protein